jgi:hypothetical protein
MIANHRYNDPASLSMLRNLEQNQSSGYLEMETRAADRHCLE